VNGDIVVNRKNVDALYDTIERLYSAGIREFDLLHIMPFGRAWKNWKELYYDPFRKKKQLYRAFGWRNAPGVHLWTNRFPPELFEGHEELIQNPAKLADEVRGRAAMFAGFMSGGELYCRGERCRYCVLRGFCNDMLELRSSGRLESFPVPVCLGSDKLRPEYVLSSVQPSEAADFYVRRRLCVKGSACAVCSLADSCRGALLGTVISRGFKCLSPAEAEGRKCRRR